MAKRKEHRWVRVSREPTGDFIVRSLGRGSYTIYTTYRVTYRQDVTGFTRREEERGIDLRTMLNEMKMEDKEYALVSMLEGGLEIFNKLVGQWGWKRRQEEEREAAAFAEIKLARKRAKRVKDRQFGRVLEI